MLTWLRNANEKSTLSHTNANSSWFQMRIHHFITKCELTSCLTSKLRTKINIKFSSHSIDANFDFICDSKLFPVHSKIITDPSLLHIFLHESSLNHPSNSESKIQFSFTDHRLQSYKMRTQFLIFSHPPSIASSVRS